MKFYINFLLLFLFASSSFGQIKVSNNPTKLKSYAHPENGVESIAMLREGTLIVRLSSYTNKIEHLKKTSGSQAATLEQERIDYANKSIIKEFKDDYKFSDVVFIYGMDLDQFLNNNTEGLFLNEELQYGSDIHIKDGPVYILSSNSTTVYKLCDINFTPISEPSIEYVSHYLDSNYRGVNAFAQGFRDLARARSTVAKMSKRLVRFEKAAY